jgi:O-antigen/teichoic acid export membrane protein
MRKSVLTFRDALGLYWYDRYKPLFEAGINLIASVILVMKIGISGVFIGTAISTLSTCFWVEPYILFKYGFKSSAISYFKKYAVNTALLCFGGAITWLICGLINEGTVMAFAIKIVVCIVVPNIIFLAAFYKTEEFKYLYHTLNEEIRRKAA